MRPRLVRRNRRGQFVRPSHMTASDWLVCGVLVFVLVMIIVMAILYPKPW